MAQNKVITDLVSLVTPNNDDVFVVVDNTTNPSLSVTKKITYASLKEALQDMLDLVITDGTGITSTYNDASNTLQISVDANTTVQKTIVSKGGTTVGTRQQLNVIEGASIALTAADNPTGDRVDLTIKNTGVSTATNLSATGTSFNVLSTVATLGDGTQDARLRPLKAASNKVTIAFADSNNSIAVDIDPSNISINDLSQSSPLALAVGGTAATTATQARANLGAAKLGANSDITSLAGLTTALSIAQGGTAAGTAQDALQNLGGLKYTTNVGTAGQSLVVNQAALVSNEYRTELKGVKAGSNKATVSTVSNDISIDINADNVLNAASNNINFNAVRLTNIAQPVSSDDVASKAYVDSVAQGLQIKDAVIAASTTTQAGAYNNSAKTFTYTATGVPSIDGINVTAIGTRILLKDQSTGSQNGIYKLTTAAANGVNPVLTRTTDFDTSTEVDAGAFMFTQSGSTNGGKQFVQTTDDPVLDTNPLTFTILADSSVQPDSVTNAKLANMSANTIKGALTNGDPNDLTADQAITLLNSASSNTVNAARIASVLDSNARIVVEKNGSAVGTRRKINFIEGSNVTLTVADDSSNEEVDVTINSTAAGGGGVSLGLAVALG